MMDTQHSAVTKRRKPSLTKGVIAVVRSNGLIDSLSLLRPRLSTIVACIISVVFLAGMEIDDEPQHPAPQTQQQPIQQQPIPELYPSQVETNQDTQPHVTPATPSTPSTPAPQTGQYSPNTVISLPPIPVPEVYGNNTDEHTKTAEHQTPQTTTQGDGDSIVDGAPQQTEDEQDHADDGENAQGVDANEKGEH